VLTRRCQRSGVLVSTACTCSNEVFNREAPFNNRAGQKLPPALENTFSLSPEAYHAACMPGYSQSSRKIASAYKPSVGLVGRDQVFSICLIGNMLGTALPQDRKNRTIAPGIACRKYMICVKPVSERLPRPGSSLCPSLIARSLPGVGHLLWLPTSAFPVKVSSCACRSVVLRVEHYLTGFFALFSWLEICRSCSSRPRGLTMVPARSQGSFLLAGTQPACECSILLLLMLTQHLLQPLLLRVWARILVPEMQGNL